MNPALTQIQQQSRAADLRERADRHNRPTRRLRRASKEIEATQQTLTAYAPQPLFLTRGFFGREHGSHA
ncbi:hypothetical protein [Conexibacter woesei]|uniref:Uncharacterized protein n=1 Tax=Conexibacter woesei (strain DSM 14684 / CCUG 47730 / CIP 108061 / JCM 11494 / NBRC 100937 / ID131577) TaxID=469383 RepID=D3FAU3_CONWI|nr:hypothetical protein [Conexibacter woesei]ADB51256.1 hypothetical protein Cwoe_2837 [Conexibacter woesei DSM 14684]